MRANRSHRRGGMLERDAEPDEDRDRPGDVVSDVHARLRDLERQAADRRPDLAARSIEAQHFERGHRQSVFGRAKPHFGQL